VQDSWLRVSLPYATYGIRVKGNLVVEAAPIARWMLGKSIGYVTAWIMKKHGTIEGVAP
jgi:hypothetical protein